MINVHQLIQSNRELDSIISVDKEVLAGKPCFKGTRVPVSLVLEYISLGWNVKQIKQSFPSLRLQDVVIFVKSLSQQFGTYGT